MTLSIDNDIRGWLASQPKASATGNKILRSYYDRYVLGVFNNKEDVEQTIEETKEEILKHSSILTSLNNNLNSFNKLLKEMNKSAEKGKET